jgi:hypothetical protein
MRRVDWRRGSLAKFAIVRRASSFVRRLFIRHFAPSVRPCKIGLARRGARYVCPRGHDIQGRLMGVGAAAVRRCASRATAVQPAMYLVMETPSVNDSGPGPRDAVGSGPQ